LVDTVEFNIFKILQDPFFEGLNFITNVAEVCYTVCVMGLQL